MGQITLIPSIFQSLLNNIQSWVQQVKFNALNTATGTTSVTLNTTNGIAVFTAVVNPRILQVFQIANSLITASSVVDIPALKYDNTGIGQPVILNYYTGTGVIYITIYNLNNFSDSTNKNLSVPFTIIG